MELVLLLHQGQAGAVMGGIHIVYAQPVYHPVQALYEAGPVHKGDVLHAGLEHQAPVVRNAPSAVQLHELAVAQSVVYLKGYLRAGGENQNFLYVSRSNSLLPCPGTVQDVLYDRENVIEAVYPKQQGQGNIHCSGITQIFD